ncbi:hypothetical protein OSTOST_22887 [Ostertagia ostertagi]
MKRFGISSILETRSKMPEFFPTGSTTCVINSCTSLGVYERFCCVPNLTECCGQVSIFGWLLTGALTVVAVILIYWAVYKKCNK